MKNLLNDSSAHIIKLMKIFERIANIFYTLTVNYNKYESYMAI